MEKKELNVDNSVEVGKVGDSKKEESEQVENISAETTKEGKKELESVILEGTSGDIEEMEAANEEAASGVKEAEEEYSKESKEEEKRLELVRRFVEKNKERIEVVARAIYKKLEIEIDSQEIKAVAGEKLVEILKDEEMLHELEEKGWINKEMASVAILLTPLIEKAIEIDRNATEKEGTKDTIRMISSEKLKEVIAAVLANPEKDAEYIDAAGKLLEKQSDEMADRRLGMAVRAFAKLLQNGRFQEMASTKFRKWLEEGKDEEEIIEEIAQSEMF